MFQNGVGMDVWHWGIIVFKVTWISFLVIYVLMLESIIAYLHGHFSRLFWIFLFLLVDFLNILLSFEWYPFDICQTILPYHQRAWFCLTVFKFCFLVLSVTVPSVLYCLSLSLLFPGSVLTIPQCSGFPVLVSLLSHKLYKSNLKC